MSEFANFIRDYSGKNFGRLPVFEPGQFDENAKGGLYSLGRPMSY